MRWLLLLLLLTACVSVNNPHENPACNLSVAPAPQNPFQPIGFPLDCKMEEETLNPSAIKKGMSVSDIMNLALSTNPVTKRAWAQARADAMAYEQSKSAFYPIIDGYGYFDNIDQKTTLRPSDQGFTGSPSLGWYQTWTNEINISYLIFDFGGRDMNALAYRMALYASNWAHAQSIQDVMNSVLQSYYLYLQSRALLKAKELDVKDSRANLDVAQASYEAGIKNKVDLLQAESNLANTILQLQQLEGQVKIALGQLATALGLPANTPLDVNDIPEQLPVQDINSSVDKMIAIAKEKRADLRAFQSDYIKANYQLKLAQAQFLPQITANVNLQKANYTRTPILKTHNYDTTLEISIPLFNGFYDTYEIKKRNELLNEAYQSWAEKEQQIILQVLTAFTNLETSREQLKTSEEFLKFAEESYQLTFESYKAGVVSFVDLLTSQAQISNARAERINAITLWMSSLSELAYAAGILMVIDDGPSIKQDIEGIQK